MTISDAELASLAADVECDYAERKAALTDKDKIGQAICAFANDLPGRRRSGVLLIGVHDDGRPAGLPITDKLLQELADYRDQGRILPLPTMTVERRFLDDQAVARVEVQPSHLPPVRYRGQIWIGVGPRRAIASADEERILSERRRQFNLPFDARSVPGSGIDDLDLTIFTGCRPGYRADPLDSRRFRAVSSH